MLGMPVAYTLGLAAQPGRALDRRARGGGDDPGLGAGVNSFSLLAIPFFCLRPARSWPRAAWRCGWSTSRAIFVGAMRGGLALVNVIASTILQRRLGLVGRRHRVDRLGADPADGREGLFEGLRHQRDDLRLRAGGETARAFSRGSSIRSNGSLSLMILAISASIAGKSASVSACGRSKVVIEPVVDRRAKRQLHAGKQPHHGPRHDMSGRMPHNGQRLWVFFGQQPERDFPSAGSGTRPHDLAVDLGGQGRLGQAGANFGGDFYRADAAIVFDETNHQAA